MLFSQPVGFDHRAVSHLALSPLNSETSPEYDERLRLQHSMFQELLGKYPPIVADILIVDEPGVPKACLDLGCGSGEWITQIARDFPKCRAVAVDCVPIQPAPLPQNLRCEIDDINLGLEHFYGQFNVVHARHIVPGINDFRALIDQISHVLRPGGLILLAEFDFFVYDENKKCINVDTDAVATPRWPLWLGLTAKTIRKRGGGTDIASHLVHWVTEHTMFEKVSHQQYWIPVSPFITGNGPESLQQRRIGQLVREDIKAFMKSTRHMLLDSGLTESYVNQLEQDATHELTEAGSPQYIRLQTVQALKRQHCR